MPRKAVPFNNEAVLDRVLRLRLRNGMIPDVRELRRQRTIILAFLTETYPKWRSMDLSKIGSTRDPDVDRTLTDLRRNYRDLRKAVIGPVAPAPPPPPGRPAVVLPSRRRTPQPTRSNPNLGELKAINKPRALDLLRVLQQAGRQGALEVESVIALQKAVTLGFDRLRPLEWRQRPLVDALVLLKPIEPDYFRSKSNAPAEITDFRTALSFYTGVSPEDYLAVMAPALESGEGNHLV